MIKQTFAVYATVQSGPYATSNDEGAHIDNDQEIPLVSGFNSYDDAMKALKAIKDFNNNLIVLGELLRFIDFNETVYDLEAITQSEGMPLFIGQSPSITIEEAVELLQPMFDSIKEKCPYCNESGYTKFETGCKNCE